MKQGGGIDVQLAQSVRMSLMQRSSLIVAITALLCMPAQLVVADIFQYTDESGVVHFSNVSVGKAKKYRKIKTETTQTSSAEQIRRPSPPRAAAASAASSRIPDTYTDIINNACDRHGVDPALVHALVKVESDFNPFALSQKG